MTNRVTILGSGNGGHALGYDLSSRGTEVMIFEHPDFAKSLDGINLKGGIEAVKTFQGVPAKVSGFSKITHVTSCPKEAMEFADIIMMIVPSFAQEPIFDLVMPYLKEGQFFVIMPGNLASLLFRKKIKESGVAKNIFFAEAPSIPYAVRVIGPGQIFMLGVKDILEMAVLPSSEKKMVISKLQPLFYTKLKPLTNLLQSLLLNLNMIVHVPTATLNMGLAESHNGQFQFYKDGMSETVSKIQQKVDDERIEIGKALGLEMETFVEWINMVYSLNVTSIRDFAENTPYHNKFPNDFPKSPKERYISEDCPYILVTVHELGKLVGVPHPAIESLINIDSIYNDTDYFKTGRTLEKVGIAGLSKDQIIAQL